MAAVSGWRSPPISSWPVSGREAGWAHSLVPDVGVMATRRAVGLQKAKERSFPHPVFADEARTGHHHGDHPAEDLLLAAQALAHGCAACATRSRGQGDPQSSFTLTPACWKWAARRR